MNIVLEVNNVYKSLSRREIIKGISFDVKEGEIFGFLGANGAGKTTTIRMLVGLIKPDKGNIRIMGYDIQKNLVKALKQVGSIVEYPDMYNDLTGRENLIIFSRMYGNVSKERIEEIIELIGLKDRIDDKVKKYSLGMKQRLGLGQALLPNPKLLILDEPTNGFDPLGIIEFRNIIKNLARENNTAIFISSHILAEIEQVCDRVAFIDKGIIKSIEYTNKLKNNEEYDKVELIVKEQAKGAELLGKLEYVKTIDILDNKILLSIEKEAFSKLIFDLGKNNIEVESINKLHQNLEGRFMQIVEEG
ncbi:ABC transporter ATP-binding protein [Clostridium sp. YIM B02515]|uniref:ABC transporter ATP-binding protein n=1 Tax=Clostridium rhizosphaerae TaxID=2803861 RepID=A0ABS1TEP4_9CLOT|nr:ABC transporter ATP-binding protein [Clostridium rhizosphaerae]MBL4937086.1 ABC transporter ATP-binding protein [Clostridium rhizosphaerae]